MWRQAVSLSRLQDQRPWAPSDATSPSVMGMIRCGPPVSTTNRLTVSPKARCTVRK